MEGHSTAAKFSRRGLLRHVQIGMSRFEAKAKAAIVDH
jgi:hypothetical protein